MDQAVLDEIHRYWFGELRAPTDINRDKAELWFKQSDATDDYIRATYGRYIPEAAKIAWNLDALSRSEQAALVVLLDQFPRNIFRGSGESFAYDARALEIARALLAGGLDRFYLVEQTFICLPFEHSEAIAEQDRAVYLYSKLAVEAPEAWLDSRRIQLDYATKHRDLIRRFGRFPHRNAWLGRESTAEEAAFIAEHGRGY